MTDSAGPIVDRAVTMAASVAPKPRSIAIESDDEVIDTIQAHMATDHPALLESVSRDDLRGWIEDV